MDAAVAFTAAAVATLFVVDLGRHWAGRPRPHVLAWTLAMGMYALATWALAIGLAFGWSSVLFRVFYAFGAILNVPFLAVGSAYLVLGEKVARRLLEAVSILAVFALIVTFTAPFVAGLPAEGVPAGSDVFAPLSEVGPTGPRFWALLGNVVGTFLLLALAVRSVVKFWNTNRRLVAGNALIVAGTVAPALGGTLTGLGEGTALSLSLLAGAAFLWAGYRVASGARFRASTETSPA